MSKVNARVLNLTDGRKVLVSYETPVAVTTSSGWVATDRKYSVTTSRHINNLAPGAIRIPHSDFVKLVEPLEVR